MRICLLTSEKLDVHYAAISTDKQYQPPAMKLTVNRTVEHLTEFRVFGLLDSLKPTAQGLDCLPSWFLRLAAPYFAKPLATLYNLSLSWSVVPTPGKSSVITLYPKYLDLCLVLTTDRSLLHLYSRGSWRSRWFKSLFTQFLFIRGPRIFSWTSLLSGRLVPPVLTHNGSTH